VEPITKQDDEEEIQSKLLYGIQTHGSIGCKGNDKECIISHYKNQVDLFLEYKKEEAKEVLTELGGPKIDSTNFNKWCDKCEQLLRKKLRGTLKHKAKV